MAAPRSAVVALWTRAGADRDTAAAGLLLGLLTLGPLIGLRPVFLLDWVIGRYTGVVTSSVLGLNGGLTAGILGTVGTGAIADVAGSATTWLVTLAFFPIAAVGVARLVCGSRWARLAAITFYVVNPFVFNRLYVGHLTLLLGYALLPFALSSALTAGDRRDARMLTPALWWAVLTALSPHFAWIYGVVVVAVLLVRKPWSFLRLGQFVAICATFALMSTYILLPHEATQLPVRAGSTSLAIYSTAGDPRYGLYANVLGLYGFWRVGPGPELPKQIVAGWPLLLLAILIVASIGAWRALRHGTSSAAHNEFGERTPYARPKEKALVLLVVGVAGFFLSLGAQGPTGPVFSWAYYHVPFFQVMREPQKFLMLLALAYAVFFGWGVERLSQVGLSGTLSRTIAGTLGVAVPLLYCPTIFWGLAGQVSASTVPSSYHQADSLMGNGEGVILYLPWHLYMSYPFTKERVIHNVGPTSFRRTVISGDDLQVGSVESQSTSPRSAYIQDLLQEGDRLKSFGALVAPLGVQFVVLAKTVDWTSYHWLNSQRDLHRIYESSTLEVWRNQDYDGIGVRVRGPVALQNLEQLLKETPAGMVGGLDGGAVRMVPSPPTEPRSVATHTTPIGVQQVHELSPVAYRVSAGAPGWVTIDTTYQKGWVLDGRGAVATAEGTMMFQVGKTGGIARFQPWYWVKCGYWISAATFIAITLASILTTARVNSLRSSQEDSRCSLEKASACDVAAAGDHADSASYDSRSH